MACLMNSRLGLANGGELGDNDNGSSSISTFPPFVRELE